MIPEIEYRDLENLEYKEAWEYQEIVFRERVDRKLQNRALPEEDRQYLKNLLLFVEHPNVYTLGKSGVSNNMLINDEFLKKINASYFHIDRGGDITYHGPGQIVGYPIFDLDQFGIHLKEYVHALEECVIMLLKEYDIKAGRLAGATGVWLDPSGQQTRKICAIGVKASRFITMHGFAFNVNTNLDYFSYINPCGFTDKGVTSMQKELGGLQDMQKVRSRLKDIIITHFQKIANS